ncbi:MAG: ribbon-helix-helix protein, CopG family [Faecalibacterium sp.]|nr:ribbon-helix-helix protein, CopG family [Ruminococcus sp.]MCM1392093.1 ribbon-helix-helix protein, CopG family [Ruminococcus sp.]MCM1485790.1 ribbon-helix-helix protein, CopG family [Faecalibacterium sp.]
MAEETQKRKTHTSTDVKRRYNEKNYSVVRASLPKEMVVHFKEKCQKQGISQAQIIRKAVEDFLNE